jgi:hypothetical protein
MTWDLYSECKELAALDRYLELLGINENDWEKLPRKASAVTQQTSKRSSGRQPKRVVQKKK